MVNVSRNSPKTGYWRIKIGPWILDVWILDFVIVSICFRLLWLLFLGSARIRPCRSYDVWRWLRLDQVEIGVEDDRWPGCGVSVALAALDTR